MSLLGNAAPIITLVVHEIDTTVHVTAKPGYRWAVHVGYLDTSNALQCANAGWEPNRQRAFFEGERVAAAAVRAIRLMGVPAHYGQLELDHDPIPPGRDYLNDLQPLK